MLSLSTVRKGVQLARNPARFWLILHGRLARRHQLEPAPVPVKGALPVAERKPQPNAVSQTLDDVLTRVDGLQVSRACVFGDAAFRDQVVAARPMISWCWISLDAANYPLGAKPPSAMDSESFPCIVVGGKDVKAAYPDVLRRMQDVVTIPAVLWVGSNFEFCGSTLPIPADADDANILLFNHFEDFFAVRDPLLVRVTARSAAETFECYRILKPRETMRLVLSEMLPERSGAAIVEIMTTNPELTRFRHDRWRLWADVFCKDSFTTLHGSHDYAPSNWVEARVATDLLTKGKVVVTLPNYGGTLKAYEQAVLCRNGDKQYEYRRSATAPVDEVTFTKDASSTYFGFGYNGAGDSFWFGFDEAGGRKVTPFFGNHKLSGTFANRRVKLPQEKFDEYAELYKRDVLFHPFALPVLGESSAMEFGLSFAVANPAVDKFHCIFYGAGGEVVDRKVVDDLPVGRPTYATDLFKGLLPAAVAQVTLILLAPDWLGLGLDPLSANMAIDLVVRHRTSGDIDVTEFQDSWRNLGFLIKGFPHWLAPMNHVLGRTKLVGRVLTTGKFRSGVAIVNASGNLAHAKAAAYEVVVCNPTGESRSIYGKIPAFGREFIWFDEQIDDIQEFLRDGYGSCVVRSTDADLNGNLVTVAENGAIGLQHLWGY